MENTEFDTLQLTEEAPPPARPRPARWPFAVLGILTLAFLGLLATGIKVPYFARSPGPAVDVENLITIDGAEQFENDGDFYFLTVSREPVSVIGFVEAWRDPKIDLIEKEKIIPPGVTNEEKRRADLGAMADSQQVAILVALEQLGHDIELTADGAQVLELLDDSPAAGILIAGDLITAVEGAPVFFVEELVAEIQTHGVGEVIELTVVRLEEELDVKVELAASQNDPSVPAVGVAVGTVGTEFVFPFDVTIDAGSVGGPSAGMMLSLGVINSLTEDDLTAGRRVAGTGTIQVDGEVGPIGGTKQKVFGAIGVGAEIILVPEENFDVALEAAKDDIEVVAVGHIDDALDYLDTLTST